MSTVATPAAPRRPRPPRWTVPEFHRLCGLGLFAGRRPILLDGVILEQGPMDAPHANGVERTDTAVRLAFGIGWRFRIQRLRGQLQEPHRRDVGPRDISFASRRRDTQGPEVM